jgi:hypothetical protein
MMSNNNWNGGVGLIEGRRELTYDYDTMPVSQAASDSVTISRECAESLLAVLDKGVSVYIDHDAATKLFGELKQALKN